MYIKKAGPPVERISTDRMPMLMFTVADKLACKIRQGRVLTEGGGEPPVWPEGAL